ncbi:hypothetical protein FHS18_002512 [Paenibacillus phyllosphaerae]|uniref:Uncharacterized protein n=1 Tax=Paenibacillus phyllosphaerae TaxID=274593 RepID=A0A7W5AX59_9BACL|nr:hypothetical protein [Paenibacillus phyllosphaerae]MBB3110445.1 hypothetical protein [Paenibacillus phyllosphaerae]
MLRAKLQWSKAVIMLALLLLLPYAAQAAAASETPAPLRPVQVFDVTAGKVIKTIPNSNEYQQYAKTWLGSVSKLAPQLQPADKCGYVFRIPLAAPTPVKAGAENITTSDVFLFYCPDKPTLLLVFDENRKPFLLEFKGDIKPFLKLVGV